MQAAKWVLSLSILSAAIGCDTSQGGAGPTKPSPNYPGIEKNIEHEPKGNPALKPTQAPGPETARADDPVEGAAEDPDTLGTTRTPASVAGAEGGVAERTSGTGPSGERPSEGGPLAKLDADAKAVFKAAPGLKLKGDAEFEETKDGVRVEVEVKNAPPGPKGIHVHQKPDCTDIPAKSMGEHFAPDKKQHGLPHEGERHLGDLGNITIDKDGEGELELTLPRANLREDDPRSLLARALVIHERSDDGSQPSGNSGKPIACAVIKPE